MQRRGPDRQAVSPRPQMRGDQQREDREEREDAGDGGEDRGRARRSSPCRPSPPGRAGSRAGRASAACSVRRPVSSWRRSMTSNMRLTIPGAPAARLATRRGLGGRLPLAHQPGELLLHGAVLRAGVREQVAIGQRRRGRRGRARAVASSVSSAAIAVLELRDAARDALRRPVPALARRRRGAAARRARAAASRGRAFAAAGAARGGLAPRAAREVVVVVAVRAARRAGPRGATVCVATASISARSCETSRIVPS